MTPRLINPNLLIRIIWGFTVYIGLTLFSFTIGYFLLPRGALIGTPWTALGVIAATRASPLAQFLTTIGFNFVAVLLLGVGLNLQRVRGFPIGYMFIFYAGIASALVAGTNSFASQVISPYTVEGWLVAFRIQHLELLGYTVIVASTISIGLIDYRSWLPWKAKETKIQSWRDIRFTRQEIIGIVVGIGMILLAGYNETVLAL